MNESSKTRLHLSASQRAALEGRVLDIGAGNDPITPDAAVFDLQEGDANRITHLPSEGYDCVYSSHCLEHMHDPVATLQNWWTLVRPGGCLFLVVPDEDLYEQGVFPSRFNSDHKATFTLGKKQSWSSRSFNIFDMCSSLEGSDVQSIYLNDVGYERGLSAFGQVDPSGLVPRLRRLYDGMLRRGWISRRAAFERHTASCSVVDQTTWSALAQWEIVLRKQAPTLP